MLRLRKKQSHVDSIEAYSCQCPTISCPPCSCSCTLGPQTNSIQNSLDNQHVSVAEMNNIKIGG